MKQEIEQEEARVLLLKQLYKQRLHNCSKRKKLAKVNRFFELNRNTELELKYEILDQTVQLQPKKDPRFRNGVASKINITNTAPVNEDRYDRKEKMFSISQSSLNLRAAERNLKCLIEHSLGCIKRLFDKYRDRVIPVKCLYRSFMLVKTMILYEMTDILAPELVKIDPFLLVESGLIFITFCAPHGL